MNEQPHREPCDNPSCEDFYGTGEFTCPGTNTDQRQLCKHCNGTGFLPMDREAMLNLIRRRQDQLLKNARRYQRPPRDIVELMDVSDQLDALNASDPELDEKLNSMADQLARMNEDEDTTLTPE